MQNDNNLQEEVSIPTISIIPTAPTQTIFDKIKNIQFKDQILMAFLFFIVLIYFLLGGSETSTTGGVIDILKGNINLGH